MDIYPSNSPPQQMPKRQASGCFHLSPRLSRVQSALSDPELDHNTIKERSVLKRSLSMPMPSPLAPPASPYLTRKPNFKIQLPPPHLSGLASPAKSSNNVCFDLDCPASLDPKPLPTFIPAPLTPPDETAVIDFTMASSGPAKNSARGKASSQTPAPSTSASRAASPGHISMPPLHSLSLSDQTQEASATSIASNGPVFYAAVFRAVTSALSTSTSGTSTSTPGTSVKIVQHAAPCPIAEDGFAPNTTVYGELLAALQHGPLRTSRFLHINHVLPKDGPSSIPPTTPPITPSNSARLTGQQSYFDHQPIIHSATHTTHHYPVFDDPFATPEHLVTHAVAPNDALISVYERVIPPNTRNEVEDFFEFGGSSPLKDRLMELAPHGTLILVYPTKVGGSVFNLRYLGPAIAPVLRSMEVENGVSTDIRRNFDKIAAAQHLPEFGAMKGQLTKLLNRMNRGSNSNKFSILYSSTADLYLKREKWETQWVHQQKPQLEEYMSKYFQRGAALPPNKTVTAGNIIHQIFERLCKHLYEVDPPFEEPKGDMDLHRKIFEAVTTPVSELVKPTNYKPKGIEVGVFVIKRSGS